MRRGDDDERPDETDVLLVAGDPRDARLISCGLQRQGVSIEVAPDGRTAIERLSTGSADGMADPLPQLVVLDLAVGSVDAETLLHAVRSSPLLGSVPVVVLSDTGESATNTGIDVETAYDLGANAHFEKSDDIEQYVDGIERLATFWFEWAAFPPEPLYIDQPY